MVAVALDHHICVVIRGFFNANHTFYSRVASTPPSFSLLIAPFIAYQRDLTLLLLNATYDFQ